MFHQVMSHIYVLELTRLLSLGAKSNTLCSREPRAHHTLNGQSDIADKIRTINNPEVKFTEDKV